MPKFRKYTLTVMLPEDQFEPGESVKDELEIWKAGGFTADDLVSIAMDSERCTIQYDIVDIYRVADQKIDFEAMQRKIENIPVDRCNTFGKVVATERVAVYKSDTDITVFIQSAKFEKQYVFTKENWEKIVAAVAESDNPCVNGCPDSERHAEGGHDI